MENLLREDFEIPAKNASEEALKKWRSAAWVMKNPTRRHRYIANLERRQKDAEKLKVFQVLLYFLFFYDQKLRILF